MERRLKLGARLLVVITLAFALLATTSLNTNFAGASGPQAPEKPSAAPKAGPTPTPPKAAVPASPSDPGVAVPMADCNDPLQVNPLSATIRNGQQFTINVYWACQDFFDIYINVYWGNGAFDQYHCWSNCSAGSASFSTIFYVNGNWTSHATITSSAKGGLRYFYQYVVP